MGKLPSGWMTVSHAWGLLKKMFIKISLSGGHPCVQAGEEPHAPRVIS
jgi:hypothetical protein